MKKVSLLIFIIAFISMLPSCTQEKIGGDVPGNVFDKEQSVSLVVNTIGTRGGSNAVVDEKVRSLRIIMISDGFLEYNTKIDFEEGTVSDSEQTPTFPYLFNRSTVPGNKKFYLIANEESVKSLSFETEETLPEGITNGISLSALLNAYSRDKLPAAGTFGYTSSGKGNELETLLNSAYFNVNYVITSGSVYLPYTAYYDGIASTDDPTETITKEMFLVPVATKFTINLNNYRKENVSIEKLKLSSFHDNNFLMAKLDDSEKVKTLAGKSYPWIEWLKIVSDASHKATDLDAFNQSVGWIENYSLPEIAELSPCEIKARADEDWTIEKLVNLEMPSVLSIVTYQSESKNFVTKQSLDSSEESEESDNENSDINEIDGDSSKEPSLEETKAYQAYYLQIFAKDENAEETAESEILEIDAAKALFRNTHVVVDVDIYDSMVDIYCQIQPWDYSSYKGYLQEVDDDD